MIKSHGYGDGFTSEFIWDGCRDYCSVVALPLLLDFWEAAGHEAARRYCRGLLQDAITLLTAAWGTATHAHASCYSQMACVALPVPALPAGVVSVSYIPTQTLFVFKSSPFLQSDAAATPTANSDHAKAVQDALHFGFNIEVPVKTLEARLYVRISAAIYNCLDDYVVLRDAVLSGVKWKTALDAAVAGEYDAVYK